MGKIGMVRSHRGQMPVTNVQCACIAINWKLEAVVIDKLLYLIPGSVLLKTSSCITQDIVGDRNISAFRKCSEIQVRIYIAFIFLREPSTVTQGVFFFATEEHLKWVLYLRLEKKIFGSHPDTWYTGRSTCQWLLEYFYQSLPVGS